MKNKQMYLVVLLIICVIVSNLALAQSTPTELQSLSNVFNEANPELFDYENGDYSTVTWSKIPPNFISKIPKDKLKYDELKPEQRIKMTPDQISVNFDKINDLVKDVDADNARAAIKNKFNINVIKLDSAKIREGILHANYGYKEHITLSNQYYQNGFIFIAEKGEIVFTPLEEDITVPEQDAVTIDATGQIHKYKGYVVKEGMLSFKEGKTFVKKDSSSIIINDVLINPTKNHAIDIYFEQLTKPNGNYVAFSKGGLDVGTTKEGEIIVMPQPGNLLFNMVKKEYKKDKEGKLIRDEFILVEDKRDKLFLVVTKGDNLKVVSRAKEGKTPLIRHFYGGGETNIQTGRGIRFTFIDGESFYRNHEPMQKKDKTPMDNSVAFELVSDADFMSNIVIRTSSSNRFIQMYNDKQIAGNNMGLEVSDLIETNMMKTVNDLRAKYTKMAFNKVISKRIKPDNEEITTNLIQLTDEWLREKEGVEKYLGDEIFFVNEYQASFGYKETKDDSFCLGKGEQLMQCKNKFLVLGEQVLDPSTLRNNPIRDLKNPLQILDHELAHAIDNSVRERENELISNFIKNNNANPVFAEKVNEYLKDVLKVSPEDAKKIDINIAEKRAAIELILKERNIKGDSSLSFSDLSYLSFQEKYSSSRQSITEFETSKEFKEFLQRYNEMKKKYGVNTLQKEIKFDNFYDDYRKVMEQLDNQLKKLELEIEREESESEIESEESESEIEREVLITKFELSKKWKEFNNRKDKLKKEYEKYVDEVKEYKHELEKTAIKKVGLPIYSTVTNDYGGTELFSTYGELPPETARKNKELAQVEFDRVMSTDPPSWLKKRADERYYAIMEGKDGAYCKANPCGPCLIYKVTCKTA